MKRVKAVKIQRAKREKVTREEALKRMETFPKRKEKFIAAIRSSHPISRSSAL
jgi:tryptophan synthase beta subunit